MASALEAWTAADAARFLRKPTAADDKYSRGVLGVRTGSTRYPGAAVLGVEAAWRTGLGMVRYLGPARESVLTRRPETVTADGRVQAWLVGSGTDAQGRDAEGHDADGHDAEGRDADGRDADGRDADGRDAAEADALRGILSAALPVVVDAGALELAVGASAPRVVTPHDREHARLRAAVRLAPPGDDRIAAARETATALGATVLLKGAVTVVATPGGWTAVVDSGVPWLATAGTGDVLAGAVGALVAAAVARAERTDEALDPEQLGPLAATAAWLHGRAAQLAAGVPDGPVVALDVARSLSRAVAEVLARV